MKTTTGLIAALLLGLAGCNKSDNKNNNNDNNSGIDATFVQMVSMGNYNETDAGQLAASKATDTLVKQFGQLMVTEHQTAQNDLRSLANNKSIRIQESPDAAHVTMKSQLMQLSGRKFDSTYIHSQVTDHQMVLNLFKNELSSGKDEDVKQYANKYLPHIQMHFNKADSIARHY